MTLKELVSILRQSGYPVAYSHFDNPQEFPYITYLTALSNNFHADDSVYQKVDTVQIELYTDKKDLQAENTVEQLLNENNLSYEVTENYIDTERMFQRIYETGVI
ncbi:hypothetical protein [Lentibacillus amyloliquefaciens]|uniref:Prophage pi2 protein 38 n=1 Tax=Lentibacillus amyloliquefaciens TaxID=1472767 RepID=A0A0U4FC95_9BACI|nr:hypothetical protein [Lentibacillus amyloliquefaciens]ALX50467.1 hypothetical protein AOX59_18900 [Lentibacillus amyloliquefaciens]